LRSDATERNVALSYNGAGILDRFDPLSANAVSEPLSDKTLFTAPIHCPNFGYRHTKMGRIAM
jgi:hypothetical protein